MFTLKFTTGIRPTEKNVALARAAQIYYHKGVYAEKPVEAAEQKPKVESKAEQKKPVAEKKPEDKKSIEQKPAEKPEQKKSEDKKPVAEQKPVAADKKQEDQKKSEDKKPVAEQKADQKKPEQKPADKPVVEVLDRKGNVVAMLPGVPEEAPKAAKTASGFDINNFVKPKQSKQQATENFGQTKSVNEVYAFIRSKGVGYPFDPMTGFSVTEKVEVLKKYANFNGTHPGLDVIQLNTLLMIFNSPDLARKMINCGLDPKQTLGIKRFNEVPANKYDNNNAYDFAFEYTLSKKKKLVLLVNSIPTYDEKQGWMSGYNISVR